MPIAKYVFRFSLLSLAFAFTVFQHADAQNMNATATGQLVADAAVHSLSSGIRYKYGGTDPETGLDCSAFIGMLFRQASNRQLPRTVHQMNRLGKRIPIKDIQAGDLVFFRNSRGAVAHVGVYVGNRQFIHASRKYDAIHRSDLNASYWRKRLYAARRIPHPAPLMTQRASLPHLG
ncbi:C40 family peptidase [Herbaspirillum sp.]|uniref:C40 family peptidase n=1 Tax=Herbaspirillum sp. TaxID=1890675 RepID=UPI001B0D66F5|nr:C40 family peptidase [Herbaspirillum sp.]MBO9535583.1 C40 family peptidase [Herbaspirillum sp.]